MRAEYDFSRAKRGAIVPVPRGKTRITIRIDDDLLAWFRARVHAAGGGSYQALINLALREYITHREERLEEVLRRVLREELPRPAAALATKRRRSKRRPDTVPQRPASTDRVRDSAKPRARTGHR